MSALPYRPTGLEMWDVWYHNDHGTVHAFHLQRVTNEGLREPELADWLGHATSTNLIDWIEQPPAFGPGETGGLDDLQPWTGCVYENDGTYYLYYTMRSSQVPAARVQRIGLATSTDLVDWVRHPENPVIVPDGRWYHPVPDPIPADAVVDARDLIIQPNPSGPGWYGFYAARSNDDNLAASSVIATVFTDDLVHWEHLPPAFAPCTYACLEVPDVFELDGRWYLTCLVGNRYGNRVPFSEPRLTNGTIFAVSDSIEGPYTELADNIVIAGDVTTGYSCRTVVLDGERYLLYTEQTFDGRDSISPPLVVTAGHNGRLELRHSALMEQLREVPLDVAGQLTQLAPVPHWPLLSGDWAVTADGYHGTAVNGWHGADLGWGSEHAEVVGTFTATPGAVFGFVVRGDSDQTHCEGNVVLGVDSGRSIVFASTLSDLAVVPERRLDGSAPVSLRVTVRGPRLQLFVDDVLVVQLSRPLAFTERASLGLYVESGEVSVTDVAAWTLRHSD